MVYTTYSIGGILSILALGAILQGLETSSMAVFIGHSAFTEYFENPGALVQGLIGGSNPVGAFIGCWVSGLVSDHCGRIVAIQVATSLWVAGSIVSVLVQNITMLVVGRAIKGITIGIFSSLLPVYVSEIIPNNKRGLATSMMQWCLTWGILIMFYLSYFCAYIGDDTSFRIAWGIEALPGLLLFFLSFMLPESPKWYASKAKWDQSLKVMKGLKMTVDSFSSQSTGTYMSDEKSEAKSHGNDSSNLNNLNTVLNRFENDNKKCSYMDLFRAELRPHLMVGIFTQVVTQLSGIGVLMYYLIFICEMIGLTGEVKVLSASIQYVVNVFFTIFPILFIDKMRRKDVLVYGSCSLGCCIGAVGCIMGFYGHNVPPIGGNESAVWEVTGTPGVLCLALCFLFVAIFASTLSCAAWLYTNEIFPARAKSKGSAICMSVSWTCGFLLTFLAPISLKFLKWGTFCVFGAFCAIGAIVMIIWFPETYGLSDHQINLLFSKNEIDKELNLIREPSTCKAKPIVSKIPDVRPSAASSRSPSPGPSTFRSRTTEQNQQQREPSNNMLGASRTSSRAHTRKSDSIQLTTETHLPLPPSPRSPEKSLRTEFDLVGDSSTRTFRNSVNDSPFFRREQSPFEWVNQESEAVDSNNDPKPSLHYYSMGGNDSPFLSHYNKD